MLQNPTIIQLIVGVITLIIFYMGMYFWKLARNKRIEKYRLFAIIFYIVTALGVGYVFFNIMTTTPNTLGNCFIASVKALVFVVIVFEIFLYSIGEIRESFFQSLGLTILSIITIVIIAAGVEINDNNFVKKYEQNIIEISDPRYEKEQYELVAEIDEEEIHAKITYTTITPYFRRIGDGDEETYKFYYKVEDEVRYKEIKAQFLTLVPIKDEEKPYYVVRNYTKYSLDYNNDPPTECNLSTSTAYELHIPKEYIELIQKQDQNKQKNKKE